jgi:hypothetical protein
MADIVDLPIKNGDFPLRYASLPEGKHKNIRTYYRDISIYKLYIYNIIYIYGSRVDIYKYIYTHVWK